ncbi:MAG: ABC transporter substrate-binding protein, partial [Oscillospiraceae bacterium]|nr:ABC transporter substrate-binding protein [Oscillospiraceae bacterium]
MCFSLLAGCSSKDSNASTPGTDSKESQSAGNEDGNSGAATIKIGGVGPLTGGAAIYGNAAKGGAEIAAEEINALGGIQIDLRYEDDAHDPEKSVNAYNTLKDWGMQVFLG